MSCCCTGVQRVDVGHPQCRSCLPQPDSRLVGNAPGLAVYAQHFTVTKSGHDSLSAAVRWQPLPCSSLPTICLAPKMCLAKTASHRQGAPRMRRLEGSLAGHSASPLAPPCSPALMCGILQSSKAVSGLLQSRLLGGQAPPVATPCSLALSLSHAHAHAAISKVPAGAPLAVPSCGVCMAQRKSHEDRTT